MADYPTSAKGAARNKAAHEHQDQHHSAPSNALDGLRAEVPVDQMSESQKKWVERAQLKALQGKPAQPAQPAATQEPQRPKLRHADAPRGDAPAGPAPDPRAAEAKARTAAADKYHEQQEADNRAYVDREMLKALMPISAGELFSNVTKGAAFCDSLDSYKGSHGESPVVKKAITDTKSKFHDVFTAANKLKTAAEDLVAEVKATAGRKTGVSIKAVAAFGADIDSGAKHLGDSARLVEGEHFSRAWADMSLGLIDFQAAAGQANLVNELQQIDSEMMVAHIRSVQTACKVMLGVIGGAGSALAKLAVATIGAVAKVAELSSSKLYGTNSELTLGSIAVDLVLDIVFIGFDHGFGSYIEKQTAAAAEAGLKGLAPDLRKKIMARLAKEVMPLFKATLSKANDRYLGEHKGETKKSQELAGEILNDAWLDFSSGKLGELIGEYAMHPP